MKPLWQVADFVCQVGRNLRFGELSRARLELLRLEIRREEAECEWMARDADAWDVSLQRIERDRNFYEQALLDAIAVRELLFAALPKVDRAVLRVFRTLGSPSGSAAGAREPPELVIVGTVSREAPAVHRVSSLAMRAKLYGFCFCFEDGYLRPMQQVGHENEDLIAQTVTLSGQGGMRNGGK